MITVKCMKKEKIAIQLRNLIILSTISNNINDNTTINSFEEIIKKKFTQRER